MKKSSNRLALIASAIFSLASTGLGSDPRLEAALKWEIYSNHQRHVPKVTVSGNEVKLSYIHGEQWTKDPAFADEAKSDALSCFKADYAVSKADPMHRLHDYFHVVEYSAWSHQVIGEATLKRAEYPSAEAVDAAIAQIEAEREKEIARHYPNADPTITTTPAPTVSQEVNATDPDLSGASEDQIKRAAQEDGILWYKTHPNTKIQWTDILSIGKGHALRRHLRGSDTDTYAVEFWQTIEGLSAADSN